MEPSPRIARIFAEISDFFRAHDISTDSLTVIFNVADRDAAAKLDFYLKRDIGSLAWTQSLTVNLRNFSVYGIKAKVESPLHED